MNKLPLSKVKKIAKMDEDYVVTSQHAMVAVTHATELFIQSMVEQATMLNHLRNPKNKQVRLTLEDLQQCVNRRDEFKFLEDTINNDESANTNTKVYKQTEKLTIASNDTMDIDSDTERTNDKQIQKESNQNANDDIDSEIDLDTGEDIEEDIEEEEESEEIVDDVPPAVQQQLKDIAEYHTVREEEVDQQLQSTGSNRLQLHRNQTVFDDSSENSDGN